MRLKCLIRLRVYNMNETYISFIQDLILEKEIRKPIYISDLINCVSKEYDLTIEKATATASNALKSIMDTNAIPELRFYEKGIYYRSVSTLFGDVGIDKEQLVKDKYLNDDNGYDGGLNLLYKLGLTTQMPNKRVLITNKADNHFDTDKELDVVVCPPKTVINKENKQYLMVLDILEKIDDAPIDVEDPYGIIRDYINQLGLDYSKLFVIANNYYDKDTIAQLEKLVRITIDVKII